MQGVCSVEHIFKLVLGYHYLNEILFIMNVLTESNKQQILSEYSGSTVEKLARKFSVSNERIKKIRI